MPDKEDLTSSQRHAVEHREGPLLVLAGPGSGKTRVITRRIARLVEGGVDPSRVLAITFTNKAAGEMAERVARLLPGTRIWISTFHRFCARLLRRLAPAVGLKSNFTILDVDDQRRIVREALRAFDYDSVHFPPDSIAERISRAKNDLLTAEMFRQQREMRIGDFLDSVVVKVYPEYQRLLLESNAVDFDDLLLHVVQILNENPEIRAELDERYQYVLVDEYQDTNLAQYQIVAALSRDVPNLCVTGDPDQSIYGWRGARIENILRFEADYSKAVVIRLEENFRSTKSIIEAADRLIAHNVRRKAKTMRTDNPEGPSVELLLFPDALNEAQGVARAIREGIDAGDFRASDVAIFYRVTALSRELERALALFRIPFQLASGYAFFERAEIKDLLAYLRLVANPQDRSAFLRIVNVPARGIGKKSLQALTSWADKNRLTLLEAAQRAGECPGVSKRAVAELKNFAALIADLGDLHTNSIRDLIERLLDRTRYAHAWQGSGSEQDQQRLANVNELITAAAQFDAGTQEAVTVEAFLETTALVADVDNVDGKADRVTLMTLHAAKGLEFPIVYLIGLEAGLLPHERAARSDNRNDYEEERRLLFVGMTRARERLYLTRTVNRTIRGRSLQSIPSEFLREAGLRDVETPHAPSSRPDPDSQIVPDNEPFLDRQRHEEELVAGDRPAFVTHRDVAIPIPAKHPLVMTGAELLAAAEGIGERFAVGTSVRHPRYGIGRVTKVSGSARNRIITVEFADDNRCQSFIADKNPLQPVGLG